MKNNIDEFIEEITTNFSDLFVETFFLRYLSNYDANELLGIIKILKNKLNSKVNKKLIQKLNGLGYDTTNIKLK